MRPHGTPRELERRRLRALEFLDDGIEPHVIAERLGVDRRSVRRWKQAYRRRGRAGVAARPASGRPPKLSTRQRGTLARWILKGADAFGFPTGLWTCRRVAQVIRERFDVHYHPDHIGRLLRKCGRAARRRGRLPRPARPTPGHVPQHPARRGGGGARAGRREAGAQDAR
jgi:transposase